jgi:adenylate cyclase
MTPDAHDEALARVRRYLFEHGASQEEIERAESDGVLDLLVADRALVPAERRYTEHDVEERSGMPVEMARRFWRALGFPAPSPDEAMFTDLDVQALVTIHGIISLGVADLDSALQLARVIGSSMARIADAEVSPGVLGGAVPGAADTGDSVEAAELFSQLADQMIPAMGGLLEFAWRRHLQAATRRAMSQRARRAGAQPSLCVGFADMVGFTVLSQQLSEDELAIVVSRFEEVAHYTVTGCGGRLVKMIGDEAMFVTESAISAARIALGLAEAYAEDEMLSDVRVGMAQGPVLVQDGDYYGPVVNLAHAVVALADPGSVLLSDDFHTALLHEMHPSGGTDGADHGEFAFHPVRPRFVKDLGRVQVWALQRPGTSPPTLEQRVGRRWERLAEVLHDIEELRERGERLITSGLRAAVSDDDAGAGPSGAGEAHGGDAEGSELEGAVDGPDRPPPEVDEPT